MAAGHNAFANLIWQIADLLRGPTIALLDERRTALIGAAATGRRDVGAAP
jgi:hypothetical protein